MILGMFVFWILCVANKPLLDVLLTLMALKCGEQWLAHTILILKIRKMFEKILRK